VLPSEVRFYQTEILLSNIDIIILLLTCLLSVTYVVEASSYSEMSEVVDEENVAGLT
jgi:hypothetical protein